MTPGYFEYHELVKSLKNVILFSLSVVNLAKFLTIQLAHPNNGLSERYEGRMDGIHTQYSTMTKQHLRLSAEYSEGKKGNTGRRDM